MSSNQWWLEVFEMINRAGTQDELFRRIQAIVRELGFSSCCYGLRIPVSPTSAHITVFDCYPAGWMKHYTAQNYMALDPTVCVGSRESAALVWDDELFARAGALWSDARDAGLRVGIAQPCWAGGNTFGLLSLAREAETLSATELITLHPRLRWLAESAHQRMSTLVTTDATDSPAIELSAREREVLSWTADGKTSWEIAQILTIAESTVNYHVKNIVSKLSVRNKVQAAAKATALGLL